MCVCVRVRVCGLVGNSKGTSNGENTGLPTKIPKKVVHGRERSSMGVTAYVCMINVNVCDCLHL